MIGTSTHASITALDRSTDVNCCYEAPEIDPEAAAVQRHGGL